MSEDTSERLNIPGKDNQVVFSELEDGSGIKLSSFKSQGKPVTVARIIAYEPWNAGRFVPGAGQVGVYEIEGEAPEGKTYKKYALIKDYRSHSGDWRIELMHLADAEEELKQKIIRDDQFKSNFADYLFGPQDRQINPISKN